MNRSVMIAALAAALLGLAACDKPTVVNVPATTTPVVVPGPAGPAGADGSKGEPGKTGDSTTVIVVPPASSPSN